MSLTDNLDNRLGVRKKTNFVLELSLSPSFLLAIEAKLACSELSYFYLVNKTRLSTIKDHWLFFSL